MSAVVQLPVPYPRRHVFVTALICALLTLASGGARGATFTVINTNDSGAGSLRQAITDAVANPTVAHDHIVVFNIPGAGVHTIRPLSQLPPIKDLTIDGYTQPGSQPNTLARGSDAVLNIELDGSLAGFGTHGLVNEGAVPGAGVPNATVRGLVINRFGGAGIRVTGPGGAGFPGFVTVRGCYIGTDASGTQALGNGIGIDLGTDAQAIIGETTPAFGGNAVPWPAYRNLISGNVGAGVRFDSADPLSPAFGTVRNAYIGTNAAGTAALGNGSDGVSIGAEGAVGSGGFGSFVYLYDNLIAANMGDGIDTQGIGSHAVGNTIGAGSDGSALGNQGNGAYFHGLSAGALTAIFTAPGAIGPGVSGNAGAGVLIADDAIVDVSGRFTGNLGLGVDLAPAGHNTNDAGDVDSGPNEGLNHPVVTSAVSDGVSPSSRIQGTIHSKPNAQIQVLLYLNASCNASGYGEAGRFLASAGNLTTDSGGNASFDSQLAFPIDATAFPYVVAQARRFAERTAPLPSMLEVSEFSECFPITGGASLPTLSINDVTVTEGNAGTATAAFTVTLSAAAAGTVTVANATANGSASAGSDYTATSGTLTFAAGETTKTVSVTIAGDTTVEPNETFVVNLSAPSGATLADATGQGTITNDDVAPPVVPTLSIADVAVTEGNAATTATFTVTLSAAASGAVTANYATADGTATAGSDYTATNGTLSFAAGETTKTITVAIVGDTVVEPDETFTVDLSAATGATIADASAQGTIVNDDVDAVPALPSLTIDGVSVQEGGEKRTVLATFTVTLSAPSAVPVTVTVSTLNAAGFNEGDATDNGSRRDYIRHTEVLTFAPGVTSLPFVVTVMNDRFIERPRVESYTVFLRNPTGATIARMRGHGSIIDDDGPPPGSRVGGGALDAWLLAALGLCVLGALVRNTRPGRDASLLPKHNKSGFFIEPPKISARRAPRFPCDDFASVKGEKHAQQIHSHRIGIADDHRRERWRHQAGATCANLFRRILRRRVPRVLRLLRSLAARPQRQRTFLRRLPHAVGPVPALAGER
jgi:hypothetical protein